MSSRIATFTLPRNVTTANQILENPRYKVLNKKYAFNKKDGVVTLVLEYEESEFEEGVPCTVECFLLPEETLGINAILASSHVRITHKQCEVTLDGDVLYIVEYENL